MPHDDELTISLLIRAFKSGFTACLLTTDTWQLGWRHDDVATSNYAFYRGIGADLGLTDPVFQSRLAADGIDPKTDPEAAGAKWIDSVWHGRAWSWEKIPWLIEQWKSITSSATPDGKGYPFCIKGIQSIADARRAISVGADGIVVSNHAGRQVDGAMASLDALENIVNAIYIDPTTKSSSPLKEKLTIMYDSGIRGGSDVIKALALGAQFVFIGRLWVWGLSIMGEEGVRHVMRSLLADFDIAMCVGGFRNIAEIQGKAKGGDEEKGEDPVLGKFFLLFPRSILTLHHDAKEKIKNIESYPKSYSLPSDGRSKL